MNSIIQHMIKRIQDAIIIDIPNQQSKRCLIGACLLNIGLGGVLIWGQVNIYFFSYFNMHNENLQISQTTMMLNIAVIPIALGMIFSIPLAEKIGFSRLIKITSILYPLGTILSAQTTNIYVFALFYLVISCTAYALNVMPVINCLYSHFPKDSGKVSGFIFACNGISSFVYSIMAQKLINPDNIKADQYYNEGGQTIWLFSEKIADNLPPCLFVLSIIYALFCIPASFLITYNSTQEENNKQQYQDFQNNQYNERCMQESPPIIQNDNNNNNNQIYFNNQNNNNNQIIQENELVVIAEFNDDLETENTNKQSDNLNIDLRKTDQDQLMEPRNQCPDIKTGILSQPFQICFLITFLSSLYGIFLTFNFKIYGLTKINDDKFLTFLGGLNIVISSLSSVAWGQIADLYNNRQVLSKIMIAYTVFGVLLPLTSSYYLCFLLFYCMIGILNNGLFTVIGPTFIKYFGLSVGTKLMPINSIAMFLSIFCMPILSYLVITYSNYDFVLIILGSICVFGSIFAQCLSNKYNWY